MLHALPVGHEFDGYRILRVLGAGGFGITYLAEEIRIGRRVAIKEYLPQSVAGRETTSFNVRPLSAASAEQFALGLDRFRQEAATLVNFEHPNIIAVHRYAEANGTAYLVMQYVEGKPLDALLGRDNTLDESEIEEVVGPILHGLEEVHAAHFLHRDVKPANIYVRMDGRPVLLDFGAARQAFGRESKSITAIVSDGYSPFEQYEGRGDQGPWTDVYGVGAVLYRCITGERPPSAPERVSARLRNAPDPMRPAREAGAGRYSERLLAATDRALGVMREERPQSIAELRKLLRGDDAPGPAEARVQALPAAPAPLAARMPPNEAPPPGRPGTLTRFATAVSRVPPPMTALLLMFVGMLAIGASVLVGVAHFEYTASFDGAAIRKEVGFLPALNWSLGALVVFPAIIALGLYTFRLLPRILEQLAKRNMVVDEALKPLGVAAVKEQWRGPARKIAVVSACVFVVAFGYSLWEYYYVIGQHYLRGAFPPEIGLADAYQERDWSVAALLPGGEAISKTANGLFALFVGLTPAFVFSLYVYLAGVAVFVYGLAHREQGVRLIPDLRGADAVYDRRAGLQLFEPLVQNALFVTLLGFLMLFLMHLQNVYLRVPVGSIVEFAFPSFAAGQGWAGTLDAVAGAITARGGLANLNSALGYGFGSFLFAMVLAMLAITLRLAAQRSRARLAEALGDESAKLPEWLAPLGREKCLARLGAMSMWPARWPRVNQLALAIVVVALCLVFYKLGLIIMLASLAFIFFRLLSPRIAAPLR